MNKGIFYVFVLGLAGVHAGASCKDEAGNHYEDGASFLAPDGCNTCFCSGDKLSCTKMICPEKKVCKTEDGKTYAVGEQFTSTDGCNSCTCTETGFPICTLFACPQEPPRRG